MTDYDEPISAQPSAPIRVRSESKPQEASARKRARQVLHDKKITKPPIPVRAIARQEGFLVEERSDLGSLRGRIVGNKLQVAASDFEIVKRFSIAHELGHHFLGTVGESSKAVEREADAFAGEMLVPGPMLSAALLETISLNELAQRFQVSTTVLRIAAEQHRVFGKLS